MHTIGSKVKFKRQPDTETDVPTGTVGLVVGRREELYQCVFRFYGYRLGGPGQTLRRIVWARPEEVEAYPC